MVTITPSERFTPYSPVVPTTVFAVGFPILDNADVILVNNGSVVAGTVVSGTYAEGVSTNATITAPVGLVGDVQVVGARVPQRTSQYAVGKPLPISDHNYALNRVEIEIQEARRETNRSLKLPVGDKPKDFPPAFARAGKYLSFDADGNPVAVTEVHEVATVAAIAPQIVTVAGISGEVVAVAGNKTNIDIVASINQAVSAVGEVADDIPTVVDMRPEIQAVISDKANIGTVAGNIGNVNKVAAVDASVSKVAAIDVAVSKVAAIDTDVSRVSAISSDVQTVSSDRAAIIAVSGNKTNIDAVAGNQQNINVVVANQANINAVAGNARNINAVADSRDDIDLIAKNMRKVLIVADTVPQIVIVADISDDVSAVSAVAAAVPVVAAINDDVSAVAANSANITAVANNQTNINAVAGNKANIDAVKNNATNINAVAANEANINAASNNGADISVVAGNIAAVNRASDNMAAIIAAPDEAAAAAQSADDAQTALTTAEGIFANMKGGTTGQVLVKSGTADYAYVWQDASAGGDMFKLNYDPRGINADVFSMGSMTETANAKVMTDAERAKLAGIAAGATANTGTVISVGVAVPAGMAATGAITTTGTITISYASGYQGYTTAEANKLAGIATGADKTPALAAVATSGSYNDLDNRPVIPAAQVQSDWNAASGISSIANKPATFPPSAHTHTKDQVGLSDVDNTSDMNKPVSTAQQAALDTKFDKIGGTFSGQIDMNGNGIIASWITLSENQPINPNDAATKRYVDQSGIGSNQVWSEVTGSRTKNTNYVNNTGKAIMVTLRQEKSGLQLIGITVNGGLVARAYDYNGGGSNCVCTSVIVPVGATYTYDWDGNSGQKIWELR